MHHGNDKHVAVFQSVNNPVRKTMRTAAADFLVERLPRFRPLDDAENGGADFLKKIMAESGNLPFIISCRRPKFASGGRLQVKFHLPNSAVMERIVSSPSSALI
jgi:hypothetical protein